MLTTKIQNPIIRFFRANLFKTSASLVVRIILQRTRCWVIRKNSCLVFSHCPTSMEEHSGQSASMRKHQMEHSGQLEWKTITDLISCRQTQGQKNSFQKLPDRKWKLIFLSGGSQVGCGQSLESRRWSSMYWLKLFIPFWKTLAQPRGSFNK